MPINLSALNMFRSATNWDNKGVANLDHKYAVLNDHVYGGWLSSIGRDDDEKEANNKVRAELLRSLGLAFKLKGMSEDGDGRLRFSTGFMDRLGQLLGKSLKRGDFGIDNDGYVASGCPLTARRIKFIIAKTEAVAAREAAASGEAVRTILPNGGVRKEGVYGQYAEKLATIRQETRQAERHVRAFFNRVGIILDYIYNELDIEREKPEDRDPSALRYHESIADDYESGRADENEPGVFEYYDTKEDKFKSFRDGKDFFRFYLAQRLGGVPIHPERSAFVPGKSHSIEPLKRYIVNNARFFVTKAIDNYFAAKEAGKLDVYFNFLWNPGACLEDQCVELTEFEANNLVQGGDDLSEKEKTDLRLIAEGRPLDLPPNAVDLFTSDVFIEIEGEEWFDSAKGWTKEVSDAAKAALRGKKCIMQDFSAEHELGQKVPEFKDADHLPIVNELTDELIDEIGPKAFREYFRVDPRGAKA